MSFQWQSKALGASAFSNIPERRRHLHDPPATLADNRGTLVPTVVSNGAGRAKLSLITTFDGTSTTPGSPSINLATLQSKRVRQAKPRRSPSRRRVMLHSSFSGSPGPPGTSGSANISGATSTTYTTRNNGSPTTELCSSVS